MHRLVPYLAVSAILAGFAMPQAHAQSGWNYGACVKMAKDSPETALKKAGDWVAAGGGFAARHCVTLALVELDRPAAAAKKLEALARDMAGTENAPPKARRAAILAQEGNAWLLADKPQKAYFALSEARSLLPEDDPAQADILLHRARAQAAMDNIKASRKDLDKAVKLAPKRADIRIFRATALRRLDEIDAALHDIEAALALAPDNPRAFLERGVLRYLSDDPIGAVQDWERVLKLDAAEDVAAAARKHLKQVSSGADATGDEKPQGQ